MDCKFVTIVRKFKSVYECVPSVYECWRILASSCEARPSEMCRDLARFDGSA